MYAILLELLHPLPWLLLAVGIGLAALWRTTRSRWRFFLLAAYLLLVIDCLPVAAYLSAGSLEWQFPRVDARPEHTRVIVVLGGGVYGARNDDDHDRLEETSMVRALRAAELYRMGPRCPILVSGGFFHPELRIMPPATLMADFLRQLGIPEDDLIVEDQSRNTEENAKYSAEILRENGWSDGVVLVTSASHLPRSVAFFHKNGVEVTPVGCGYHTDRCERGGFAFWPRASAAAIHHEVLHEWIGMLWAWLRGKL